MHISSLWIDIEPLRAYTLRFERGVNLLRGRNGVGKTAVMEAIALSGHMPVMPESAFESIQSMQGDPDCRAVLHFTLSESDCTFLVSSFAQSISILPAALAAIGSALHRDCPTTSGRFWTERAISLVRKWVETNLQGSALKSANTRPTFALGLMCKLTDMSEVCSELKHSLADEQRLQSTWTCGFADESAYLVAGLLLTISRPERIASAASPGWTRTYRAERLDATDAMFPNGGEGWIAHSPQGNSALPGLIAYLNTDMYQFGIGLDVRESPKEMGKEMTELLVDRLQLFRRQRASTEAHGNTFRIRRFFAVQKGWTQIFEPTNLRGPATPDDGSGDLNACLVRREASSSQSQWTIDVGKKSRGFFSSGENQTFYMLALTQCTSAFGSCILIDEPELHLSLGGASTVFDYIHNFSNDHDCQIIVVTHVPFLFSRRLREGKTYLQVIDQKRNRRQALDGTAALDALRETQAKNVQELFDDIRVPDNEIGIFSVLFQRSSSDRRRGAASWLKRFESLGKSARAWLSRTG